eukprot:scaffold57167_cov18-Tisochrysis_lutea.AAC.1
MQYSPNNAPSWRRTLKTWTRPLMLETLQRGHVHSWEALKTQPCTALMLQCRQWTVLRATGAISSCGFVMALKSFCVITKGAKKGGEERTSRFKELASLTKRAYGTIARGFVVGCPYAWAKYYKDSPGILILSFATPLTKSSKDVLIKKSRLAIEMVMVADGLLGLALLVRQQNMSPLLVVINDSTEHLKVRTVLMALAESQLELLANIMPQHAIQEVEPVQVMAFLNTLFSHFDKLVDIHGVHK